MVCQPASQPALTRPPSCHPVVRPYSGSPHYYLLGLPCGLAPAMGLPEDTSLVSAMVSTSQGQGCVFQTSNLYQTREMVSDPVPCSGCDEEEITITVKYKDEDGVTAEMTIVVKDVAGKRKKVCDGSIPQPQPTSTTTSTTATNKEGRTEEGRKPCEIQVSPHTEHIPEVKPEESNLKLSSKSAIGLILALLLVLQVISCFLLARRYSCPESRQTDTG